jgi:hypothetical protein
MAIQTDNRGYQKAAELAAREQMKVKAAAEDQRLREAQEAAR